MFTRLVRIVRGVLLVLVLGVLGTGGWMVYRTVHERERLAGELAEKNAQLEAQAAKIDQLTRQNQKLSLALRLLKIDHRLAEIQVLDQQPGDEHPITRFQFVELTSDGNPLGDKKVFTVEGDTVYVDAWVIKYDDELIEANDPLRSTSVCLFRRIFGEYQEPSTGFPLDPAGSRPAVYSQGNDLPPLERDIWANFWQYANNPAKMKEAGLRAVHGEAPSIRLEPHKHYKLLLRASGGLSIVADDLDPKPAT